jgi:hypothetical protein
MVVLRCESVAGECEMLCEMMARGGLIKACVSVRA